MKFYFRETTGNLVKTYQYILLRILVGLLLAFALVATLVASVWLWLTLAPAAAASVIVVLFLVLALVSYILGPYLLYVVEAGHVAVLTHVITEDEVPTNQIRFGLAQVRGNFASVTGLFVIDLAIRRVLCSSSTSPSGGSSGSSTRSSTRS